MTTAQFREGIGSRPPASGWPDRSRSARCPVHGRCCQEEAKTRRCSGRQGFRPGRVHYIPARTPIIDHGLRSIIVPVEIRVLPLPIELDIFVDELAGFPGHGMSFLAPELETKSPCGVAPNIEEG